MSDENIWTIRRCLEWTRSYLERKGDEHPRLSAEWMLSAVTGKSRMELYVSYDEPLSPRELSAMHGFIERRAAGEPLQYVTGRTGFRFIELSCAPGVLIPRPETEILVDAALEGVDAALAAGQALPRVLEIGCGTGCVSLAIASERQATRVTATDVSPEAVGLARANRDELGLGARVDVVECDLAAGVAPELMGGFSVLVSNPPYIPDRVMAELPGEVANFEPRLALAGGEDGLDVFRRIVELAPRALASGGMLAVELYEGSLDQAASILREAGGWERIEVRADLTHRPRVLVAARAGELPADEGARAPRAAARIVACDQDDPSGEVLADAEGVLAAGGVVVMPTDSVYGIGVAATPHNLGLPRVFEIKRRDPAQTLPLLLADAAALDEVAAEVRPYARSLARRFWPGALTLVVDASKAVPPEYRRADGTVAVRVPNSALVRALARDLGCALAVTSANTHGYPAPAASDDIERRIADAADLTLAAGPTPSGAASTIVDCTGAEPRIIRHGAIPDEAL